jgi:Fic/DOC family protein
MAGAALLHALVHDHPFHNGNKRTAVVSLIAFLNMNGELLEVEDDELFDYLLRLAAHRLLGRPNGGRALADDEVLEVADWIDCNTRKVEKRAKPLQFRELRVILARYGAELKVLKGGGMLIKRGEAHSHIAYAGEGREVAKNTIHEIRKDLALDDEHHVDSEIFYRGRGDIPAFISSYRDVLARLSRV